MRETNDALHNPFKNRFHDPVTWRLDEMQAHANVLWLRQHEDANDRQGSASTIPREVETASGSNGDVFAGAFAFFLVLVASVVVLIR